MPRTRRQNAEREEEETQDTTMAEPGSTVVQMSADQLQQLLAGVQAQLSLQLQQANQGIQQQLEDLRNRSPTPASTSTTNSNSGNFVKCSSRFAGGENEDVAAFIDAIETFKNCANVSDENALRGLPMLLTNNAAMWYQGIKETVPTWNDALEALRASYGPTKPAYQIYRDIFAKEQASDESTDLFVARVRSLFAKLTDKPSESIQLDMVYGLLNRRIRKRIMREDIQNYENLLQRARTVERNLTDCAPKKIEQRDAIRRDAPRTRDNAKKNRERPRCTFCARYGHTVEECRKHSASYRGPATATSAPRSEEVTPPSVVCYGCGAPGYVRSKCPTCNRDGTGDIVLNCITSTNNPVRPMLPFTIYGRPAIACADSGAQVSIAGRRVYEFLRSLNTEFIETKRNVTYADGVTREMTAFIVQLPVKIITRTIINEFIVLPELMNNKTLLGVDFLEKAGIVINLSRQTWHFADEPSQLYAYVSEEAPEPVQICTIPPSADALDLRGEEGENLTAEQRLAFNALLKANEDVFRPGGEPTEFGEHVIETGNHRPISVPPYRMPPAKKEFLQQEIDRMLADGIIEECESPWGFPVVLVPKKDGKFRLCVDYRKLNAITTGDSYPLPRIEDLLHSAKQAAFMSTLDLQCGYWQVRVRETDRDKTCFVCPLGTFRFLRMPFGLKNSGCTFQRMMDRFRAGLGHITLAVYLDDLIVISESFDEHLNDLRAVFERLRLFKLRARREKCVFACPKVRYLGHLITSSGIQTDPEKVSAILEMKAPRNVKEVLTFYQTCSWYRRFIPQFSEVARPLSLLTRKDAKWEWGESQQNAFDELKRLLSNPPILRQADPAKPFTLRTDASDYAIGAVLLQGDGDDERPVEYASRLLTTAETRYSTTEREALAVVWAVERFRGYIEGSEVTIATDHQPLKWLLSLKSPSGRLARWALKLQPYNLKIGYIPGKRNVVADTLSRPPSQESTHVDEVTLTIPSRSAADIRAAQRRDAEVRKIMDAFEEDDEDAIRWAERGYMLLQGVLYRQNPDEDIEEPQQVVPEEERERVLREYHDSPTAGHYGVERTLKKIVSRYYFTGMRKFISDYVKNCAECQKYKALNLKPSGLLQTPVTANRFEVISVDLFGPLPVTVHQNRWILVVEDTASKWTELYPLTEATASECAKVLIEEVFMRYGVPRKVISDNGVQFISAVMQKAMHCLRVTQTLTPLYHPASNPVERKNRDIKTQLGILVGDRHSEWDEHLAAIRFAINTTVCETTGQTPAYLTFARELRSPDDVSHDLRAVIESENFVPQITPYLKKFATILSESRDRSHIQQDRYKAKADQGRRAAQKFSVGDLVLITTRLLSDKKKGVAAKFSPKRDGPYRIKAIISPTAYEIEDNEGNLLGKYHVEDVVHFRSKEEDSQVQPVMPRRRRGRPRKEVSS